MTERLDSSPPATEDRVSRQRMRLRKPRLDPSVREAREKLTHRSDTPPEFEFELLSLFARNSLKAAIILPFLAMIVAIACLSWASPRQVGLWFGATMSTYLVVLLLCYRLTRLTRKQFKVHVWRRRLLTAEFIHGCSWGAIAWFGLTSGDHRAHMFVLVALTIVTSLRMLLANAAISLVYAGTLPITIALLARFWTLNTDFYWAMASLALGVYIFFIYLSLLLHANTQTTLELRAEKDALIADLEEAKSFAEEGRRSAEAANLAKSRFLATMSHELRTPLNAIIGFSEMMKDEMLGAHEVEAYKNYSNDIHHSGQHLLNLINEILDITRIEAGKYDLNEEAVDIARIAEDCCNMVTIKAEAKNLKLTQSYQAGLERLWADERAIRQIVLNLLSNAVKFTPSGGRIEITAGRTSEGGQYLTVKDNGPGIPEDELPRVLTDFGQGSLAHENAEGGTGLGLSIVRGLVTLHDGRFDLQSKLREGTTVTALFPQKRVLRIMPQIAGQGADAAADNEENRNMPPQARDGDAEALRAVSTKLREQIARQTENRNSTSDAVDGESEKIDAG